MARRVTAVFFFFLSFPKTRCIRHARKKNSSVTKEEGREREKEEEEKEGKEADQSQSTEM